MVPPQPPPERKEENESARPVAGSRYGGKRKIFEKYRGDIEKLRVHIDNKMPRGFRNVEVKEIENRGLGLVCKKEIKEGAVVAYLTKRPAVPLTEENLYERNDYWLQIGELLFNPPASETELAGLVNDALSDEGNQCKWKVVRGIPALVAMIPIEQGEEICVAYGWAYWARLLEEGESRQRGRYMRITRNADPREERRDYISWRIRKQFSRTRPL